MRSGGGKAGGRKGKGKQRGKEGSWDRGRQEREREVNKEGPSSI